MGDRKNDDDDDDTKEDSENEVEEKEKKTKKKRENYRGIADAWIEEIATSGSSRKRKERFVQIDGHTVLNEHVQHVSR